MLLFFRCSINDVREFAVLRQDGPDGSVTLSLKKLESGLAWDRAQQQMDADVTVDAVVVSVNKGGLLVRLMGVFVIGIHSRITFMMS